MAYVYKLPKLPLPQPLTLLDKYMLLSISSRDRKLTSMDKSVFAVLIERYRADLGYAKCSNRMLHENTGYDKRNLIFSVKRLVEHGYCQVIAGNPEAPNRYVLCTEKLKPGTPESQLPDELRKTLPKDMQAEDQKITTPDAGGSLAGDTGITRGVIAGSPHSIVPVNSPVIVSPLSTTYRAAQREEGLELQDTELETDTEDGSSTEKPEAWPDWRHEPWAIGFDPDEEALKLCDKLDIHQREYKIRRVVQKWMHTTIAPNNKKHAIALLAGFLKWERW